MKFTKFARAVFIPVAAMGVSATYAQLPEVTDIGLVTGYQESWFGHLDRSRANLAVDFDLDGWTDFYFGNPGDEAFVVRNTGVGPDGYVHFELVQVLADGDLHWGASAADYDNDNDYDIVITNGANEGIGWTCIYKNEFTETGQLSFTDVSAAAGILGPTPPGGTGPIQVSNANATWGDYDRDGDVDLFVNVNIHGSSPPELKGRNILWRNNGDGTFSDVTDEVGLGITFRPTRHSTWLDFDNDGDIDLYENNYLNTANQGLSGGYNVLWRNRLSESGVATFQGVTKSMSAQGEDLQLPLASFASASADFNNDGWQDIMCFIYGEETATTVYGNGHTMFMNQGGLSFKNMADIWGVNNPNDEPEHRTMGCQIGDLNADGTPDIYFANGGPVEGEPNKLFVSDNLVGEEVHYVDMSAAQDFPAPENPLIPYPYPPFPYRSHGTVMVDVDNDGVLELAVNEGGPSGTAPGGAGCCGGECPENVDFDAVQEPNRLFKFDWGKEIRWLKIRPVGNAVTVSRDGVSTRMGVRLHNESRTWTVYNTVYAGSAFSAQNPFDVYFGLADADAIDYIIMIWPDGKIETLTENLAINQSMVIYRTEAGDSDDDDDVDLLDYAAFIDCQTAPGQKFLSKTCAYFDLDFDKDVDAIDFGRFQAAFVGPPGS